jgi:hypothetical protein
MPPGIKPSHHFSPYVRLLDANLPGKYFFSRLYQWQEPKKVTKKQPADTTPPNFSRYYR